MRGGVGRKRAEPEAPKTMRSWSLRIREEGKQIGARRGIQPSEARRLSVLLENWRGPVAEQVRARVEAANPESPITLFIVPGIYVLLAPRQTRHELAASAAARA
ncbi:hypothetical protein [uncultured Thiohalocapsa sp.]|uniref:hypothetical protein n=1 Tax=uncultured Thiohalocapsa sp. TaxID=768990 RepID=UPI0025EFC771|nr:hypothetical protein [uncultured Thiohalocapsa sp.]